MNWTTYLTSKKNFKLVRAGENFTRIEYLQSDGNAYIDTGVKLSNTGKWEFKSYAIISGTRFLGNTYGEATTGSICIATTDSGYTHVPYKYSMQWNDNYINPVTNWDDPLSIVFEFKPGEQSMTVNGVQHKTSSFQETTLMGDKNIFVFATESTRRHRSSFYYLKIYTGTELVRDFIPVKDEDGTPCLYDQITKQFFYNANSSGTFTAGPEL